VIFKKFHPAYAMPIKCFLCDQRTTFATNMIEAVDQSGAHFVHVSCFKRSIGYFEVTDAADPDTLQHLDLWSAKTVPHLPVRPEPAPPEPELAPLSSIPEAVRTFDRPPEERSVPASDLVKVAQEVADKGVFTVVPYKHGSNPYTKRTTTQCKVLINWDNT
jgi:hypothetical protein